VVIAGEVPESVALQNGNKSAGQQHRIAARPPAILSLCVATSYHRVRLSGPRSMSSHVPQGRGSHLCPCHDVAELVKSCQHRVMLRRLKVILHHTPANVHNQVYPPALRSSELAPRRRKVGAHEGR